jgi:hypothetical protein
MREGWVIALARHITFTIQNYSVMAASRGSAYRPPRISPRVMKRALRPTGDAACFTTDAQEFLGGRYALPRDAAMMSVWEGGSISFAKKVLSSRTRLFPKRSFVGKSQ